MFYGDLVNRIFQGTVSESSGSFRESWGLGTMLLVRISHTVLMYCILYVTKIAKLTKCAFLYLEAEKSIQMHSEPAVLTVHVCVFVEVIK